MKIEQLHFEFQGIKVQRTKWNTAHPKHTELIIDSHFEREKKYLYSYIRLRSSLPPPPHPLQKGLKPL